MVEEKILDKILLIKPQNSNTYIRKLSMSYGYYSALAIVNDQNKVTHMGINNSFEIKNFIDLTEGERELLGADKCKKLKNNDMMSVYKLNKTLKLNYPIRLKKPCLNMRFSIPEETYEIKKMIKWSINNDDEVLSIILNKDNEERIVINLDLNLTNTESLKPFTEENVTGQTTLI